ncbi:MAG: lipolytic enzyme, G-D-S-L [Armatimonadetes bacterium]|nr:lipolytic enzyme, G-D-S-L [Armatimonadota bacterium]
MRLLRWLVCCLAVQLAFAADPTPALFRDGDVVCFIGDSITHSRKYHGYLYDYYLTRFPERRIRFVNCGISGDSAGGALQRLEWDVLPHRPTVASIMLGMNDVGRGLYGKENPDEATLKAREAALENYRNNMRRLVQTLAERAAPTFIFVRPSPYDQTVDCPTPNLFGVNEALGRCGDFVTELARERQAGVVDFHGPMTALNLAQQRQDPKFTLVGTDRVHPGDLGMMVMAYLYLRAQGAPALVSRVAVNAATAETKAENATVSDVVREPSLSFSVAARALPWPIEPQAAGALALLPIEQELNQELLTVSGLPAGSYRLSIDGQAVGVYDQAALGAGINLALNGQTPQARQAMELHALNEQRRNLEVRLRSVAQIDIMLDRAKVTKDDPAAVEAYFATSLERFKASGMDGYFGSQFENWRKTKPQSAAILEQIENLTRTLWTKNQPLPRRYELQPQA